MTKDLRLKFIYRYGKQFCIDKIMLTCAIANFKTEHLDDVIQEVKDAVVPIFPLKGRDIINLGIAHDGQTIGKILDDLEFRWIDSGFNLTREELLEKAAELK